MIMSKWQPKTRGGYPVENVRPHDNGIWKWAGEVTHPDGSKFTLTWTEDGYHMSHRRPNGSDLVPLEAPAGASADPDPRKALAEAAKAYKRAQDAEEAAHAAERKALGELNVLLQDFGGTALVGIDGEVYRFELDDDEHEVAIEKIEVL
jgi:hypothetical protein